MERISPIAIQDIAQPEVHTNGYHPEELQISQESLIPTKYDPSKYGAAVKAFMHPEESTPEDFVDTSVPLKERASYNGHLSRYEEMLGKAITETGVYNAIELPNGERKNIAIHSPEAAQLRIDSLTALQEAPVEVIAPFAREPFSIEGVIEYTGSRVGKERVHAINAGVDQESAEKARATGAEVADQQTILKYIDLQKLKDLEIIPQHVTSIAGSKGLTMYVGLLVLAATGKLDNNYVVFHDTDIINPEEYAALDYMGIPLAHPIGPINAVNIMRTGAGRNNESWHGENQHYIDPIEPVKTDEEKLVQELAHHLGSLGWPLTGERMIRGDILRQLPWPTDMNIETFLNVALAGIDLRNGYKGVMQVANPAQKMEAGESTPPREWGLLYGCESGLKSYYHTIIKAGGSLPHEWDEVVVGYYNHAYGNRSHKTVTKSEHEHQPNQFTKHKRGLLMPSIDTLIQLGAVDLEGIRRELQQ